MRESLTYGTGGLLGNHRLSPEVNHLQPCILMKRWERIPISQYLGVIDRYRLGPPRPERRVGRHVHSVASPNRCPVPCEPGSGKAGPVRSAEGCPAVSCWD
jgi:hypothetical protein